MNLIRLVLIILFTSTISVFSKEKDSLNYVNYKNGIKQTYRSGKLYTEEKIVSIEHDSYVYYSASYNKNGVKTIDIDAPVFGFVMKHVWAIFIILVVLFWSRVLVSSYFINCEEETDNSPIFIKPSADKKSNYYHSLRATYSFWLSKSKPENEFTRKLNNRLTIIFVIFFLAYLIIATLQSF